MLMNLFVAHHGPIITSLCLSDWSPHFINRPFPRTIYSINIIVIFTYFGCKMQHSVWPRDPCAFSEHNQPAIGLLRLDLLPTFHFKLR